jgi:Uma2 family endonuclease
VTAEELLRLRDDGQRHELLGGVLRSRPLFEAREGLMGGRIAACLGMHIQATGSGGGFLGGTGFLLNRNPDTVRAPSFAVIGQERWPVDLPEGYVAIAPDMVLEVVSPGDSTADVREKVQAWLDFGVGAVWVLYAAPRLDVFLSDGTVRSYGSDDEVDRGGALPGFRMTLGAMLGC